MVMLFRSDTLPNFAICWLLFPFLWRKQYIFSTINPNCSARRELKKSTGITSPPYLTLSLTNAIVAPGAHTLYISAYTKASSVKYPCTILIIPSLFKSPCSSLCFSAFVTSLSTALSPHHSEVFYSNDMKVIHRTNHMLFLEHLNLKEYI